MNRAGWWLAAIPAAAILGIPLLIAPLYLSIELFSLPLSALVEFAQRPSLLHSIGITLLLALLPTMAALYVAIFFVAGRRPPTWIAPLLAMPHVAFAVGMSFILVSDGWLSRLLPMVNLPIADKSLTLTLLVLFFKELPFLLLMAAVVMQQLPTRAWYLSGASLGYSRWQTFTRVVLPAALPRLRLPLIAVAVYALAVVDVVSVVGPNLPAPLALRAFNWQQQFAGQSQAFAILAQWLLLMLTLAAVLLVIAHERALVWWARRLASQGPGLPGKARKRLQQAGQALASTLTVTTAVLTLFALLSMLLWSVAQSWPGDAWRPQQLTLAHWRWEGDYVLDAIQASLGLALVSASVGLVLSVLVLELQVRVGRYLPVWLPLLPILLPQLPMVIGWQLGISYFNLPVGWLWVAWSHTMFCFAYAYLMLNRDYLAFDSRWLLVAASVQKSPLQAFVSIKLRMLAGPLIFAWAVAFSVSILQYVPTVLLGAGRVVTITMEATAYGSGFERSLAALYALGQVSLPALVFVFAVVVNRILKKETVRC
ncbi:MAG: hypothetical protein JJU03_13180 [Idiomarina sp.]|nr:hypothetical protein [Idiomarina sp.]